MRGGMRCTMEIYGRSCRGCMPRLWPKRLSCFIALQYYSEGGRRQETVRSLGSRRKTKNTDGIDMLSVFLYLFLRCETGQRVNTTAGAVHGNAQGCSLSAPAHGRDAAGPIRPQGRTRLPSLTAGNSVRPTLFYSCQQHSSVLRISPSV